MNTSNLRPETDTLRVLLRAARPQPVLPPRFEKAVWQRIESAASPARLTPPPAWLDTVVAWVLRPRWAIATAAATIVAGLLLGAVGGSQAARQVAQARYLAAVAPNQLR